MAKFRLFHKVQLFAFKLAVWKQHKMLFSDGKSTS